jgi:DNA-binding response OmpR family regulator
MPTTATPVLPVMPRILLVEDDEGIAQEVAGELTGRGYGVTHVANGLDAMQEAMQGNYSLLVVDRLLPGLDGVEVIRRLLDLIDREAHRNGRLIELLPREFKLLEYLMRRENQVVTRAMLLEDVWHYRFVPQTNLVDVHIGKLRRKVDAPGEPVLIESVRGTGFMMRAST